MVMHFALHMHLHEWQLTLPQLLLLSFGQQPNVTTKDDGGKKVPAVIKDKWKRWCLKSHPDHGGDHEVFVERGREYELFKDWFKEHSEEDVREARNRCQSLAAQKDYSAAAKKLAEEALAGLQIRNPKKPAEEALADATKNVGFARDALQAYIEAKKPSGASKAQCEEELRRLDEIEAQTQEHLRRLEREQQQREEHQALADGLKALAHAMLGADSCSALSISGQFGAILARYNDEVHEWAENKRALESRLHEAKQSFDNVVNQHCEAKNQWADKMQGLETELEEARQEIHANNKALDHGSGGWLFWPFSANQAKPTTSADKIKQLRENCNDLNARLKSSESRVRELEQVRANLEASLRDAVKDMDKERVEMASTASKMSEHVRGLQADLKREKERARIGELEMKETEEIVAQLQDRLKQTEQILVEKQELVRRNAEEFKQEKQDLERRNAELTAALQGGEAEKEELKQEKEELERRNAELTAALQGSEEDRKELKQGKEEPTAALEGGEENREDLKVAKEELERRNAELTAALQEKEEAKDCEVEYKTLPQEKVADADDFAHATCSPRQMVQTTPDLTSSVTCDSAQQILDMLHSATLDPTTGDPQIILHFRRP